MLRPRLPCSGIVPTVVVMLSLAACDRAPPPSVSPALAPSVSAAPTVTSPPAVRAPTPPCPESGEGVSMSADSILSGPIAFDLYAGSVAPESLATVDAVARRLLACASVKLEIQVHTDAFRASSFNARASQRVAEAVRDRLVAGGVDAARLVPCGYGESRPITSAPGIQPRDVNARVEWRRLADSAAAFTCPAVQE